jgi:cytochrome P450
MLEYAKECPMTRQVDSMQTTQSPPGPRGDFLVGVLLQLRRDALGFLLNSAQTYGDVVRLPLGPATGYMVNNPDLIHELLVDQADKLNKSALDKEVLGEFLGNGLIISDGDFWKRQRKLVSPAFHRKRIETYAQMMVDYTLRMLDGWSDGQTMDVEEAMLGLTRAIITRTLFNTELSDANDKLNAALTVFQKTSEVEYRLNFAVPDWIPTSNNRQRRQAAKVLDTLILGIIAERRASTSEDGVVNDAGDLLSMLLTAQDEDTQESGKFGGQMTDRQVRDEAATLFAAGHETTTNALNWTWYLLSQNPEVEACLHAELDEVLAGRAPTLDDRLPYTEMVIREVLRLYPPAWLLNFRQPIADVTVGGCRIPKGSLIFLSPYVLHRDPRWFEQPERFWPERWKNDLEKRIPRYAFFPFGGGPRVCVGNAFALMELRLVLATAAQRYRLRLEPEQQVEPAPLITLRPKNPLRMRAEKR